ncbi:MAG TPA: AraC family transcriptional regulator, partial [Campylobacterales bacterium]|nr:AraC family transcriptional regulator [Campylobacterales bacterium]
MSHKFKYSDFGEFLVQTDTIKQIIFPDNFGIMQTDSIVVNENIVIHRNNFSIQKDILLEYDFILNGISINISLDGGFEYKSHLSDFQILQQTDNTILTIGNKESGTVFHNKNNSLKNIIIFVKLDFLKQIFDDNNEMEKLISHIENKKNSKILKSRQSDILTKLCAYDIYNSSSKTNLDIMYIQSKVLEILSYELKDIFSNTQEKNATIKFCKYDIEALHLAKKILTQDLKNTPSLTELSRQIKLNEFKLKVGFKRLFGTSPYIFLLDYKLHEAKKLLKTSDLNVTEISSEMGYTQV